MSEGTTKVIQDRSRSRGTGDFAEYLRNYFLTRSVVFHEDLTWPTLETSWIHRPSAYSDEFVFSDDILPALIKFLEYLYRRPPIVTSAGILEYNCLPFKGPKLILDCNQKCNLQIKWEP